MGSNTSQRFLVQLDIEMSSELEIMHYGVYYCKWYIIHKSLLGWYIGTYILVYILDIHFRVKAVMMRTDSRKEQ